MQNAKAEVSRRNARKQADAEAKIKAFGKGVNGGVKEKLHSFVEICGFYLIFCKRIIQNKSLYVFKIFHIPSNQSK